MPLNVSVGLDAGEAIPYKERFRGGALNLPARLCSLAGPGEVLERLQVVQAVEAAAAGNGGLSTPD